MSAEALPARDRVRGLVDAILDRAHEINPGVRLTVLVGEDAGAALLAEEGVPMVRFGAPPVYGRAVVAVVPTLRSWLVMVVPALTADAFDAIESASFYGDLRTNTFATSLPPHR